MDVIDRVPGLAVGAADVGVRWWTSVEHKRYIALHGQDMPEIGGRRWGGGTASVESPGDAVADHG